MKKLKQSSVNPEDLMHPSYREHIVNYLIGLTKARESVVVVAIKGYGLSRMLRFITYGNYPAKSNLQNTKLVYINLLDFTSKSIHTFISYLNEHLNEIKNNKHLCFIIDELGVDNKTEDLFRLLKGFRGKNTGYISFIIGLSVDKNTDFNISSPKEYITDLVDSNIIRLPPLSQVDFYKVAEEMIARFGLIMTRKDIARLYEQTKGVPSELRAILQNKFKEKFLGKVEQAEFQVHELELENGHILCNKERIDLELTKAEEAFLALLIENRGEVVSRDQLSVLLSPDSDGLGVSNESIDQVIYRLRKKLIKFKCKEEIQTYTGKGYGLID